MSNTVTQEHIDQIINKSYIETQTILGKCTVVACQLPNGFIIVESSACVDPANYDEVLGKEICIERIKNKVWELEGYLLQDKVMDSFEDDISILSEEITLQRLEIISKLGKEIEKNIGKGLSDTALISSYQELLETTPKIY